jgi:hypothetical protein
MSKVTAGVLSILRVAVMAPFRGSAASGSADIVMLRAKLRALRQSRQAMAKDSAD